MKRLLSIAIILTAIWFPSEAVSQTAVRMVQCEGCTLESQMRSRARNEGVGRYYVFSLSSQALLGYRVEYDQELGRLMVFQMSVEQAMVDAFALMLEANALHPNIFMGQQTFIGDIGVIGGGPHSPVEVSISGEHSSEHGAFVHYVGSCLSSPGCAAKVDPALGRALGAEIRLNSLGLSFLRVNGNITFEHLPPSFKVWLCDGNGDCALVQYSQEKGWYFVEARSERGLGNRYPKYGEDLNYNFSNSGEAGLFQRGLEDAGVSVLGSWSVRSILGCTSVDGYTTCQYYLIPD